MSLWHGVSRRCDERGQALLELAVFGVLALAALGFLIRVGMQANYEQEVRMAAFRRAMAAADALNNVNERDRADAMAVGYHYIVDRQMPDPLDGFMGLTRNRTEASAFVEWGDHLTFAWETPKARLGGDADRKDPRGWKTQPLFLIRQNDQAQAFRQNEFDNRDRSLGSATNARRGSTLSSTTTNQVTANNRQTGESTAAGATTTTTTETVVNLRDGTKTITSEIGGGGSTAGW